MFYFTPEGVRCHFVLHCKDVLLHSFLTETHHFMLNYQHVLLYILSWKLFFIFALYTGCL